MILPQLFHWSPSERRLDILREGLKPYSEPTVSTSDHLWPYICLATTPSMAWGLSGDMDWMSEIEEWDLWQINVPANAEVRIRPFFGDKIEEIKVYTPIPADHVWWVAQRTPEFAIEKAVRKK